MEEKENFEEIIKFSLPIPMVEETRRDRYSTEVSHKRNHEEELEEISPNKKKTITDGQKEAPLRINSSLKKVTIAARIRTGVSITNAKLKFDAFEEVHYEKLLKDVPNWRSWKPSTDSTLFDTVCSLSLGCAHLPDGAKLIEGCEVDDFAFDVHFYKTSSDGALSQELSVDDGSAEKIIGSQLWNLPCVEFESIWENLYYTSNLKNELIAYVESLINISQRGADMNIITVNRMIMLLGPPGTGKTSLCRGLSQLLSIRMNHDFKRAVMFEINSHSLFSKWFSESGKLVQRMFDQIDEMAEDKKCMVFVLIDEVESLGMSRETSSSRGDPADSIRAVNALLTQIDRIRRRQNVLIMCTSNLEKCLDPALVDRTDFMRHVGQPSQIALYTILHGCVVELQRIGLVADDQELHSPSEIFDSQDKLSLKLWNISEEAIGLSGRAIRQIPALACAMSQTNLMSLEDCLINIQEAIKDRHGRNKKPGSLAT